MWAIAVHGGAGEVSEDRFDLVRHGCGRAVQLGVQVLESGGSALDAVEAAVRQLEQDPEFNAGCGSALTRDGTVEVDAAVMVGQGRRLGAVGAVPDVRHPVTLARRVMESGEHVLLVAGGALAFAREHGIEPEPGQLATERARERLQKWRGQTGAGTVGAVALDTAGQVAAATSTGGMTGKRSGRVGDTPIPGAGTWADERAGACSATGHGEAILRVLLAREAVDRLRAGEAVDRAALAAVEDLFERTGSESGLILVDLAGRIGIAHHSRHMPHAFARQGEEVQSRVA